MSQSQPLKSSEDAAIAWLARLRSDEITEQQKEEFNRWLSASPSNQIAFIKADQLWKKGSVLQKVKAPESKSRISLFNFEQWQGLAAACLFLLAVTVYFFQPNQLLENQQQEFISQIGELVEHQLVDGSKVTLNTNTRLSVNIQDKVRIATLHRGEAIFDVESNPQRPFFVETSTGLVRVLGTRFSVQTLQNDTLVTVIEGSVGLGDTDSTIKNYSSADTLTANQRHSIKAAQLGKTARETDALAALAWKNKQLIYRGETLGYVISDINRYFTEDIQLASSDLQDREVIVVLKISDASSTVSALTNALSLNADYSQNAGEIIISAP